MGGIEQIGQWISENESLFSGLAAIVALIAIVPAALRPILRRRKAESAAASDHRPPALPDVSNSQPRLAVLPFEPASASDEDSATATAMTDDLTTLLARSHGCEVISGRSSSAFAERRGTTAEALEELGVQYVVDGQIRMRNRQPRISASLIDTQLDRVVWTENFDAPDSDVGAVSQPVAEQIASHLGIELTRAEIDRSRRRTQVPAARDRRLAAQGILFEEGHSRASYQRAIGLLDEAILADPKDAEAYSFFALLIALGKIFDFVDQSDATRDKALNACRRAIELDDRSSDVLGYAGCAYCDLRQMEQGIPILERAIQLNPSNAQARAALGTALIGQRRIAEGVAELEHALRISPAYKGIAPWATVLASGYLRLGQLDDAAASNEQSLRCDPSFFPAYLTAAVLALMRDDREGVRRNLREATRLNPELSEESMRSLVGRDIATQLAEFVGNGAGA